VVNIAPEDLYRFVEGYFDGIRSNFEDNSLSLFLHDNSGKKWTLVVSGGGGSVFGTITEMRDQNIIHEITLWDKSSDEEERIDRLLRAYFGFYVDKKDVQNSYAIDFYTEKIKSGEMFIIELEPVCGADVLILGEKAYLEQA